MSTPLETAKKAINYLSEEEMIEIMKYINSLLEKRPVEAPPTIPPIEEPVHVTIDLTGKQ